MMVEVADVVDEDEAEGEALVVVQPDVGEGCGVGVLDGVGEVTVEREPEGDDFGPGKQVEALQADPIVLLVAGEVELGSKLQADEALQVVVGRVDEVADGLLRGPFAGSEGSGGGFGRDGRELVFGAGNAVA